MSTQWQQRPEGGGRFAIWLIRAISMHAGRGVARVVLYPITLYFFLRRPTERRSSREFFRRIQGRPGSHWQAFKNIHYFSSTILDRVFLLRNCVHDFDVEVEGLAAVDALIAEGRGLMLLGSHYGSFEILRALSEGSQAIPLRVVLDKQQTPALTELLEALAPEIGARVIDSSRGAASVVLAAAEATARGEMIALLADRARTGEHTRRIPFLGSPAPFPTGPWMLAASLKVPVVLCFGTYCGGNRYKVAFELFSEQVELPRATRAQALHAVMTRYAERLAHHARNAPYNWFNLYDFWQENPNPVDPDADRVGLGDGADA